MGGSYLRDTSVVLFLNLAIGKDPKTMGCTCDYLYGSYVSGTGITLFCTFAIGRVSTTDTAVKNHTARDFATIRRDGKGHWFFRSRRVFYRGRDARYDSGCTYVCFLSLLR